MKRITRLLRGTTRTARFGMAVVLLWVLCAVFANVLAPYGSNEMDIMKRVAPPMWEKGGTSEHPLGTDEVGRDILTRLIYGTRVSLLVGIMAVAISLIIGTTLGLVAGYFRGWADIVIMRTADMMLAFPFIFLALCIMAVLGSSLVNVIITLGVTGWVPYARTVRALVLSLRRREFVIAAHTNGCGNIWIILRHILPNVIDLAIILGTIEMGTSILAEASLTFLGMGVPPSIATWGNMVATGRGYIYSAWWITAFPGLAIFLVCLSVNFVGDWVRDTRDPRLRGSD